MRVSSCQKHATRVCVDASGRYEQSRGRSESLTDLDKKDVGSRRPRCRVNERLRCLAWG